jgi:hypothetical protein
MVAFRSSCWIPKSCTIRGKNFLHDKRGTVDDEYM